MLEMLSLRARAFALFAICIWAMEFVILPVLLLLLRGAVAAWYPAVLAMGPLFKYALYASVKWCLKSFHDFSDLV